MCLGLKCSSFLSIKLDLYRSQTYDVEVKVLNYYLNKLLSGTTSALAFQQQNSNDSDSYLLKQC